MRVLLFCAVLASALLLLLLLDPARAHRGDDVDDADGWVVYSRGPIAVNADHAHAIRKETHRRGHHLIELRDDDGGDAAESSASVQSYVAASAGYPVYVERNVRFTAFATNPTDSWALDRIDQPFLPLNRLYTRDPAFQGRGQHIYIVDTGVYPHGSFLHPVQQDYTAFGGSDCNGHGTHVAGLAASIDYGVASEATIHSIQVLKCDGTGFLNDVINGLMWVRDKGIHPSVINLSLGSPAFVDLMRDVIADIVAMGSIVLAAAGNNGRADACTVFPALLPTVVAVGASTRWDTLTGFTNVGTCVNVYAPGEGVLSAATNSSSAASLKSGTSMATPLVAGVAAVLLERHGSGAAVRGILDSLRTLSGGLPILYVNISYLKKRLEPDDPLLATQPPQQPPQQPQPPAAPAREIYPMGLGLRGDARGSADVRAAGLMISAAVLLSFF